MIFSFLVAPIANGRVADFGGQGPPAAEAHKARSGDEQTIAEIIYWERPEGGRVFHTGSIATAWGMYYDAPLSKLVKNVLHHFKVTPGK